MVSDEFEKLKYPIGRFVKPETISEKQIKNWILDIEYFPKAVEETLMNITIEQLNLAYRPEGWNIKQVVHHCSDSHINAFTRFKLTLTENSPTIKPYLEDRWAELVDGTDDDISNSLLILKGLHAKWAKLLKKLSNEDLKRGYIHPEHGKRIELDEAIGLYAWHSNHHLAHIKQALTYNGYFG